MFFIVIKNSNMTPSMAKLFQSMLLCFTIVYALYSCTIKSDYMLHGGSYENELFDKAFCSKSWNKLLMAVRCKEEQTGSLFFEMNHWSMTRYSGVLLSFDEFEVESLDLFSDVKRATVTFTVYESDTYTPARIYLVYEDGRWMIDDFRNLKYMIDVRNAMWDYIAKPDMI